MILSPDDLARSLSNERLHLILMPTEACNFRCVYCYEDFKYRRMEPWVVEAVRRWIKSRAPRLRSLHLSWFGGEPLLARGVIRTLMGDARSLADANPDLLVTSNATTNGHLLAPAILTELVDLGVTGYQISFDGPREFHDRKRILAGGGATFDRIWGNLLAAREVGRAFSITIRVHLDQENADSVPGFLEQVRDAFGGDERFDVYIRGLSRLGGPNDAALPVFERDEGAAVIERVKEHARGLGLKLFEAEPGHSICYAARANSFVVRANGRLNKCTIALEEPSNQVGLLREDGTVDLKAAPMVLWMRGLKSGDAAELKCPMRGMHLAEATES
ncbi:MAG TPA: radical SAM protein [Candidatus Eisenbacteria bacterium]|nr:radical SAM protein [Candidatus Eisenbacteria bacterium]